MDTPWRQSFVCLAFFSTTWICIASPQIATWKTRVPGAPSKGQAFAGRLILWRAFRWGGRTEVSIIMACFNASGGCVSIDLDVIPGCSGSFELKKETPFPRDGWPFLGFYLARVKSRI